MKLINGDCLEETIKLENNSIDLCLIDPPYNVSYKYGQYKDNMEHKEYINTLPFNIVLVILLVLFLANMIIRGNRK